MQKNSITTDGAVVSEKVIFIVGFEEMEEKKTVRSALNPVGAEFKGESRWHI